jgi:hypothetical protein
MNRQQRRQAARSAKKEGAIHTATLGSAKFVVTMAQNTKTGESRLQVTPNSMPMIDMFATMGDASVCEYMVETYVHRDDDLAPMEMMHFTNWCLGLQNSKFGSHMQAFVRGTSTLEEAKAVIEVAKAHLA